MKLKQGIKLKSGVKIKEIKKEVVKPFPKYEGTKRALAKKTKKDGSYS